MVAHWLSAEAAMAGGTVPNVTFVREQGGAAQALGSPLRPPCMQPNRKSSTLATPVAGAALSGTMISRKARR